MSFRKSVRGRSLGLNEGNTFISRDGLGTGGAGEYSEILLPGSAKYVSFFEDFLGNYVTADSGGDIHPDSVAVVSGDTGNGIASAVVAGTNGIFRLYSTAASATLTSAEGQEVNGGLLQWQVGQGPGKNGDLRFSTRIKLASVSRTEGASRMHVFAGFTDVTTYEHAIYDTGGGVQSAATDAFGFMFSAGGDTGWSAVAVDGNTDATPVSLDTGAAADVWTELAVHVTRNDVDTGGVATFFIDGVEKGTIDNPCGVAVPLTWAISAWHQDTGTGAAIDIDWVAVSALRDTGD